ncbi:hypothetical protein BDV59DRAFT_189867 [Aspergillus ambiguus]|uniref:uncharacterized protein n=1 Tax=Aspergillus ambiguus TaxID=176160 RepID=UPI003CCCCEB0
MLSRVNACHIGQVGRLHWQFLADGHIFSPFTLPIALFFPSVPFLSPCLVFLLACSL